MDDAVPIQLAQASLEAYRATTYVVETGERRIAMRIGQRSDELAWLHARHGTACSCFVTACNPYGVEARPAANDQACRALLAWLVGEGYVCFQGEGRGDARDWLPEQSYLALGVGRSPAEHLCERFHQNAVVWIGEGAVPELVLHPRARVQRSVGRPA